MIKFWSPQGLAWSSLEKIYWAGILRGMNVNRGAKFTSPREIAELNIEHLSKLLQTDIDGEKRRVVEKLLAEEREKLRKLSEE